jgi:hypothetical protein
MIRLTGYAPLSSARRPLAWAAMLCACTTLGWLVFHLNRGFELTDESFYILSAIHADRIRFFFTPVHWVSSALWAITGSLVAFRTLGLFLVLASAIFLAWVVLVVAPLASLETPLTRIGRGAVLATAASGAMLYGSLLSFTPSYNNLGMTGASFAMGFGLLALRPGRYAWTCALVAGIMVAVTVLCKFSAGVCTAGLLAFLHLVFGWRQRGAGRVLLVLVLGAVSTLFISVLGQGGVDEVRRQFEAGVEVLWYAQGDKSTFVRIARSTADMSSLLLATVSTFAIPLACFAVGVFWRPMLFGCIGIVWFCGVLTLDPRLVSGGTSHYYSQGLALTTCLLLALLASFRRWASDIRATSLVFALVALPVAVALGTSNPLQIQILTALAPWGLLIALFGFSSRSVLLPVAMVGTLFNAIVLFQVVSNGAEPYRMRPLTEQTEAVEIGQLGILKVDALTASLVRDIGAAASTCEVRPGTPFVDFYNLPGVALIVGGVPIESPWFLDTGYANLALKNAPADSLQRAVLAVKLEQSGSRPVPPRQLQHFPMGFTLCGRSLGPFDLQTIELWAPLRRP